MKYIKVDPITHEVVATGGCPDFEIEEVIETDDAGNAIKRSVATPMQLPETDDEGYLIVVVPGNPRDFEFDPLTWAPRRKTPDDVVALRRKLAAERRAPLADEAAAVIDRLPRRA